MPHRLSLTRMSELILARKLSPVELVDAHLQQIERQNPRLNALVMTFAEDARREAQIAEANHPTGELHGIPVTIKDSLDVAGSPTRCGSRFNPSTPASSDSYVAARLKKAGAVIVGKTNCPEFLMNYETDNHLFGRTNNPWDLERTPGGSSGGEAAAIASFCSAGGIGSDGGGSIRIPAHCCGIAGLKPTPGRVPGSGHVPKIGHPGGLLGVVGPMARTAEDVRMLFRNLAGYDNDDPFCVPMALQYPTLAGLRVGVMEQFYRVPVQPSATNALHKAVAALGESKIAHEPLTPKGLERSPNVWWFFFGEMSAPLLRDVIQGREEEAHWTGTEFISTVSPDRNITGKEVIEQFAIRDRMRASLLHQMEEFPVLLMPVCGVPAWKHRERSWPTATKKLTQFEAMMPVTPWNLLGLPAMVIPFDVTEDGLPVGVQLVGRPFQEELLLELAVKLEHVRGAFPAPPDCA